MLTLLSLSKRCTVEGHEPLDRAARERELDAATELHCVHLSPENPIRGKPFTGKLDRHQDFPESPWCAWRNSRDYLCPYGSHRVSLQANAGIGYGLGGTWAAAAKHASAGK